MPNSNQQEVTTLSLTTTTNITTKVTSTVGGCFRKPPPPLPPRQMSLPPLSKQPPLIEDEDEEFTPTPSTTPTPKAPTSSVGSSMGPNTTEEGSIASIEAAPYTAIAGSKPASIDEVVDEDMVFKEVICQVKSSLNFGPSQISLSSWSSQASVATRTNTDNPTSMSHIVTNFNISRTAAAAVHHQNSPLPHVPSTSALVSGLPGNSGRPVGVPSTEGSVATPASSAHSASSSTDTARMAGRLSSTSTQLKKLTGVMQQSSTPALTSAHAKSAVAEDNKEYTPLRVFKQTPV